MKLFAALLLCLAVPTFGAPQHYHYDSRHSDTRYGHSRPANPHQTYRTDYGPQPLTHYNYRPATGNYNYRPASGTPLSSPHPKPVTRFSQRPGPRTPVSSPFTRTAPKTVDTAWGVFPLAARNALSREQRNQYLPVMRALLKVMETSTPASEDVNTLLVLTRDLTKSIPEGTDLIPSFNGFNVGEMGLPEDGDVIVNVNGVPHIVTQFGAFPLSDVSLMTNEQRAQFLPATRTFISVLEKDNIDQNEIQQLIKESDEISKLIPEQFRNQISQTVNANLGSRLG